MTWRTRLKPDCCKFGRQFPPEHDEKFLSLSIREAVRYYTDLLGVAVSKGAVEEHRKCLEPRNPDGSRMDPLAESAAKADVESAVKAIQQMTPEKWERDQRIVLIMKMIGANQWHGSRTVRALCKEWDLTEMTIYRYMADARKRMEAGRGGVLFEKQVSIQYTTMLRNEAKEAGDLKAAILAQKHLDSLTGALAPPSVQVNQQINIVSHPLFQQIFEAIADELSEFPDAFERVQKRLETEMRQLSGGVRGVIDVDVVEPLHGGA
jgi:hypothetical protein